MICRTCRFETERLLVNDWHTFVEDKRRSQDPVRSRDLADLVRSLLTERVTASLPLPWQGSYTRNRARSWVEDRDREGATLLAVEKSSGSPVGLMILHEPGTDESRSPEVRLGYLLAEAGWGRGLATELVSGFVDWCRETSVATIVGGVEEGNDGSIRVLRKCGFEEVQNCNDGDQVERFFRLRLRP